MLKVFKAEKIKAWINKQFVVSVLWYFKAQTQAYTHAARMVNATPLQV